MHGLATTRTVTVRHVFDAESPRDLAAVFALLARAADAAAAARSGVCRHPVDRYAMPFVPGPHDGGPRSAAA